MGETELCPYVKVVIRARDEVQRLTNIICRQSVERTDINRDYLEAARGLIKDPTSREGLEIYSENDLKGNENGNETV